MPDDMITPAEASKILGAKVSTMAAWRRNGTVDLPFYKIGKLVRYSREDVERFKAESRVGPEDYVIEP